MYDLMEDDGISEEEIGDHQQAMQKSADVLGEQNFYQKVMDEFQAQELKSGDLLEFHNYNGKSARELLEEEGIHEAKVCFLERPEK